MDLEATAAEMSYVSDQIVNAGLVHVLGGNFSARAGDRMAITGHRSAKRQLTATDLYEVSVDGNEEPDGVSKTLGIHRAILRQTGAGAVVHAHPYHATLLSYYTDAWHPIDENGIYYLGKAVSTVSAAGYMQWDLLEEELAAALTDSTAVILKWHGTFTIGDSLIEALNSTQAVELSARLVVDSNNMSGRLGPPLLPDYASPTPLPADLP